MTITNTKRNRLTGKSKALPEFARYTLASALALAVDYSTYRLLVTKGLTTLPAGAAIGYCAGLVAAYFMITRKVFSDGWLTHRKKLEFTLFALSGLLGIGLTYGTVTLVVAFAGKQMNLAKLIAVGTSFIGVYTFRKTIVFRRNHASTS